MCSFCYKTKYKLDKQHRPIHIENVLCCWERIYFWNNQVSTRWKEQTYTHWKCIMLLGHHMFLGTNICDCIMMKHHDSHFYPGLSLVFKECYIQENAHKIHGNWKSKTWKNLRIVPFIFGILNVWTAQSLMHCDSIEPILTSCSPSFFNISPCFLQYKNNKILYINWNFCILIWQ